MNFYQPSLGGNGLMPVYNLIKTNHPQFNIDLLISHERPEQEILAKFLPADSTVLELGAGQGCTAIVIDKMLSNPTQHVVIDPSKYSIDSTSNHRSQTNSQFQLLHGFLAKNRKFQEDLWADCKLVPNFSLEHCKSLVQKGSFDVLSVDCEGAFLGVCQDYPELLQEAKLIVIEMDGDKNNCDATRELLKQNNFMCVHSQCHPFYGWSEWTDPRKFNLSSLNPASWHNGIGFHEAYVKF
jgi:hypothetical protein